MEPLKYIFYFFLVVFIGIQFIRPAKNDGEVITDHSFVNNIETPQNIRNMLSNACYDCHSNSTKYPWYADISPVSWYISGHVEDGKNKLNFSEWQKYPLSERRKKLEKISDLIKRRWMPLHDYLGQHPEAFIREDELESYSEWFANLEID
ncbi:MAG: heme-binding domain-containing protein [Bacteroidota bacterium]